MSEGWMEDGGDEENWSQGGDICSVEMQEEKGSDEEAGGQMESGNEEKRGEASNSDREGEDPDRDQGEWRHGELLHQARKVW